MPPFQCCGLGQIDGKLVLVGGRKKNNEAVNEVYTYEESTRTQRWKQIIPPMPTARWSPSVLSLQSALVVAGETVQCNNCTAIVEIFKSESISQWYRTFELHYDSEFDIHVNPQLIAIDDKCYTLGESNCDQIFVTSVDDLLRYAVPAIATSSCDPKSVWKSQPLWY